MATAEAEASRDEQLPPGGLVYDGFVSYSHAADDLLAPRLQAGLQRFAKPWWKRRALRIFRDESSLSANPHLWSSITDALDESGWFVLLLSPEAAESEWVNQEIEYWLEHKDADRIIPVLTDGNFAWTSAGIAGDAVPATLHGAFSDEPRWVDLRFARTDEQLDLKNPQFSAAVADVASAIRGVPKDELASEEVRQHRRTLRTAWAAGAMLAVLAVVAVGASILSAQNAAEADRQAVRADANAAEAQQLAEAEAAARSEADANAEEAAANADEAAENASLAEARELAASAINLLDEDPELSILLTLEAIAATPEGQDQPAEVIDALWRAVQEDRLVQVVETGFGGDVFVALSPDDSTLFVVDVDALVVQAYSTKDLEKLWEYQGEANDTDFFTFLVDPTVSPDGERVSVGTIGVPSGGGFIILGTVDGTVLHTVRYPGCRVVAKEGWSPDGTRFVVTGGFCQREGVGGPSWAEVLDGETFEPVALVASLVPDRVEASFDDSGRLFLFTAFYDVTVHDPPAYAVVESLEGVEGYGDVSADGSTVVTFAIPDDPCLFSLPIPRPPDCGTLAAYSTVTGERTDLLVPLQVIPSEPGIGFGFSDADRLFAVPTDGARTLVWDTFTGDQVFSLPSGPGVNAAVSSDGLNLYTGHGGSQVKVWDLSPNVGLDPVGDMGAHRLIGANTNTLSENIGAFVAIDPGIFESQVFFFDRATGALVGQPVAGVQPIDALADGRFVITGSYVGADRPYSWFVHDPMTGDRTLLAGCDLDLDTGLCPDGEPPPVVTFVPSLDGTELLRQGFVELSLVDPGDGSVLGELTPAAEFQFVGGFSDQVIIGSAGERLLVEDRVTGDELAHLDDAGARFEVSADADMLAFYKVNSMAMVDPTTWDILEFPIELGRVRGIAIETELRRLALGDENGLHIFNFDTGELLVSIRVPGVSDIHWISKDRVLLGTQTGVWATVSLLTEDLIDSARAGVTRSFSPDECETYRIDRCPTLEEIQSR